MAIETSALSGTARFADDTKRRFMREIVARVPVDRIVEVHVFAPIRQGGMETGVAVVAARRVVAEPEMPAAETPVADVPNDASTDIASVEGDETETELIEADAADIEVIEADSVEVASDDAARAAAEQCDPTEDAAGDAPIAEDVSAEAVGTDDAPASEQTMEELLAADLAVDDSEEQADAEAVARERHTVFTARYRLTIRGPDRGRWDADVVEEADAPLVTVDAVVRGVQRRAGDASEPDRLDAEGVARLAGGRPAAG